MPEETQETPEPTEEEKRKAEEEAAARLIKNEAKANDPVEKGKKWLSKLRSDQAVCLGMLREAKSAVPNLKEALRLEYVKMFTDALGNITKAADGIQQFLANPKHASLQQRKPAFLFALSAFTDFRKEKKAWEGLISAVKPKAKPTPKAKEAATPA